MGNDAMAAALTSALRRFVKDECGATAIEYAIIAAGVGVAISAGVWSLGSGIKATFYDKLAAMFD
jgi:pilus assembly protein Flp/PilA